MLSLDTETTGLDLRHGARPFFVTTCDEEGEQQFWEWEVDPLTREPATPREDIEAIGTLLRRTSGWANFSGEIVERHALIGQNPKFDCGALASIGITGWPWPMTRDTLVAGHVLASNHLHDLTSMAIEYLGVDIGPYEERVKDLVKKARTEARKKAFIAEHGAWRIAKEGDPDNPSFGGDMWKNDMWLPRALVRRLWVTSPAGIAWAGPWVVIDGVTDPDPMARFRDLPGWDLRPPEIEDAAYPREDGADPRWTVLREYANTDSATTLMLWQVMREEMKRRGLWEIYLQRIKVLPIAYKMESRGVTLSGERLDMAEVEYEEESDRLGCLCVNIARRYEGPCPDCAAKEEAGELVEQRAARKPAKAGAQREMFDYAPEDCETCGGKGTAPYNLILPKTSNNNSLRDFCDILLRTYNLSVDAEKANRDYGHSSSESVLGKTKVTRKDTDTGLISLNKNAIESYEAQLPPSSIPATFFRSLRAKRKRDTARTYMSAYRRFWKAYCQPVGRDPVGGWALDAADWYVLHPSLNPTGTDTLRWSSQSPNEQNISKQENFNLRSIFGPAPSRTRSIHAPGREWWSLDYKNLELRIPAYESGETEMIALFERPDEPPYYGSNHLLNFHTVYPDLWDATLKGAVWEWEGDKKYPKGQRITEASVGPYVKKKYASTWYQWVKNGGFAVLYGAVDRDDGAGTADLAFHRAGSHARLRKRFRKMEQLNQRMIRYAEIHGYVETMVDPSVCPDRGYPILCSRTERGRIKPTVPLNYHVQSTAMWLTQQAMIRCDEYLETLNRNFWGPEEGYFMNLQVHDELAFDFPRGECTPMPGADPFAGPWVEGKEPWRRNLPIIRKIQALMAQGGQDIGIPTPVSVEYHPVTWAEGITL